MKVRFLLIFFLGCTITEESVVGTYYPKIYPKSTLKLFNDGSYEFNFIMDNPYIHPFAHPDQYFFTSKGTWDIQNKILHFQSYDDSLTYPLRNIINNEYSRDSSSIFKFYDINEDPIPILFVEYGDSTSIRALHRSLGTNFKHDFGERDTLTFYFYGYPPWRYINGDKINRKIDVKLIPEYRPHFFDSVYLKAHPNYLKLGKGKFKRK